MAGLGSGGLVSHVLENGVGGFVGKLEAAAEVDELCGDAVVEDGVALITGLDGRRLVLDGLLRDAALVGGEVLAGGGFEGELEDLERVGILGGGCCDTEGVAGGEGNL